MEKNVWHVSGYLGSIFTDMGESYLLYIALGSMFWSYGCGLVAQMRCCMSHVKLVTVDKNDF